MWKQNNSFLCYKIYSSPVFKEKMKKKRKIETLNKDIFVFCWGITKQKVFDNRFCLINTIIGMLVSTESGISDCEIYSTTTIQ